MNKLQELIKLNSNWKELLEQKNIKIKEDKYFYIFIELGQTFLILLLEIAEE